MIILTRLAVLASGWLILAAGPATAQNGLSPEERAEFYHLAEGSEIFPVDWLRATTSVRTGEPFLKDLGRFGLLDDPNGATFGAPDEPRIPVGVTVSKPTGSTMVMLGVNCAACHVGEARANGTTVRFDGGPALFDIQAFYQEMFASALATVTDEGHLIAFLTVLKKNGVRDGDIPTRILIDLLPYLSRPKVDRDESSFEGLLLKSIRSSLHPSESDPAAAIRVLTARDTTGLQAVLRGGVVAQLRAARDKAELLDDLFRAAEIRKVSSDALPLLLARIEFLKKVLHLKVYDGRVPIPGPGRVDAFSDARNFLFDDSESMPPASPVRFPILWGLGERKWLHWDGNTNSVMERNVGQAMGLGAIADPKTNRSTILPAKIHRLEELVRKLTPPQWPAAFGPVDTTGDEYKAGAKLFSDHCASCHEKQELGPLGRRAPRGGVVYDVGTDDQRLKTFGTPMKLDGTDFAAAVGKKQKAIKLQAFADHKAELDEVMKVSKLPLDLPENEIVWQKTDGYVARRLDGIWANAPYLHNGSVPTLSDLLLPADKRPIIFPTGHREYDPKRVGYVARLEDVPVKEQSRSFVFDTRIPGNRNSGHEFGTELGAAEKSALLVYLKAK